MEEMFKKFCRYYVVGDDEKILEELKEETGDNFKEYQKKAIKYVKNLRRKANKLGFDTDFESFCNCLEKYINIKDDLSDEEKKNYLKVLVSLSYIHEIDLREELERYVTIKEVNIDYDDELEDEEIVENSDIELERDYFKKICLHTLNGDKESLNDLREEILSNNIDLKKMEQKAIGFVKEIRELTKRLGFGVRKEDLYKMVDEYNKQKKNMNNGQKAVYLKILMYLSSIYEVNLRELLSSANNESSNENDSFFDCLSNPLENGELLKRLLEQRYNNGSFQVEDIVLSSDLMIKDSDDYDYNLLQVHLVFRLMEIFLEKFNNYEYDELKTEFVNLVSEEDIQYLNEIKEDTLYNIVLDMKKGEVSRYICKKYKFSENVYKFIYLCIMEVANLKQDSVGRISMFRSVKKKNNLGIFINGSELEILEFICEYIVKCVNRGLSYELKGVTDDSRVVLYSSVDTIESRLSIIEEISQERRDIVENFGTPLHMTGRIEDSFYGIAGIDKNIKYEEYINEILEVAYYRTIGKLVLAKVSKEEDKDIISNFISLLDVTFSDSKLASNYLYGNVEFGSIKDLINQYIPYVINSISIYMEDDGRNSEFSLEFKKSIRYVANVINGKNKKDSSNIILNLI